MNNITSLFDKILKKHEKLEARLRNVDFDISTSGKRLRIHGNYPAFRDGKPQIDDFLNTVHKHIVPFCLPRHEIKKVYDKAQNSDEVEAAIIYTDLINKAQKLFMRAKKGDHRSGEAAEIILFLLNEWILKAPQIVSKMYLKTNSNMPVYGTDGIHARYDVTDDTLYIYWGESKAHSDLSGALSSALSSISKFIEQDQQSHEINIVNEYIDLGDVTEKEKNAVLEFLSPYEEKSNSRKTFFSCLLVFGFPSSNDQNLSDKELEDEFVKEFKAVATEFLQDLPNKINAAKLQTVNFEFFLLPVESSQSFRDKFQALIGWPDA